jgi:hypothetical protein
MAVIPNPYAQGGDSGDLARVFVAGHSYASGDQNTEGAENWPRRLCAALRAEMVLYANSGAVLAMDLAGGNPGGYPNVLNALTPRIYAGTAWTGRTSAPYLPLAPAVVFDFGGNDLSALTASTATNVTWFSMAATAICCIARAGGYFPDTDGSVAYGSGWTANTGQQEYSWPTNHSATSAGGTITLTVPADFPGGEICIFSVALSGGTRWSTVVDGGVPQVLDGTGSKYGSSSDRGNLVVQRLAGLAAGAHTIVITAVAIDSGASAVFTGWTITSPWLPAVVLVNQPDAPAYPFSQPGSPHTPITWSDVQALNAGIAAVAASFSGGTVRVADIATAFAAAGGNVAAGQPGSLFVSADNLHPNAAGHALIAETALTALRAAPYPAAARMVPMGMVWREINGPLEPQLASGWGIINGANFAQDRSGNTQLRLSVSYDGSPAVGQQIVILPPGYGSSETAGLYFAAGAGWAADYASAAPAVIGLYQQTIGWYDGESDVEWDVVAQWFADDVGS